MDALQVAILRAKCAKYDPPPKPVEVISKTEPKVEIQKSELFQSNGFVPRHVQIQRVVAEFYGVTRSDILSSSHQRKFVKPRWVAALLVKEDNPGASFALIGGWFGGKNCQTVMDNYHNFKRRMDHDLALRGEVDELRQLIAANSS